MRLAGLSLALLCSLSVYCQQKIFDIRRYGASSDGKTTNTVIIQKAIDEAASQGGGTVLVPAGRFVTGVLLLKSNVNLHLAAGAVLLGSTDRNDYGPGKALPLIMAVDQHHISITGKGTIDGQGTALLKDIYQQLNAGTLADPEWKTPNPWHQTRPSEENRPKIVGFTHCDGILVKGITLLHALDWVEEYKNCSDIIIDSIRVESNTFWNNDGIDLVDCKNASVTHSFFNADDDGICLKSEDRNGSCENIYVAHCTVRSSASAIKLGTAGYGGFKKITIRDITVYDTYRSAIALECVDGGKMEDVDIRNVRASHTGNAIFIRLGHRNRDSVTGCLRHIHIENVTVEVPKGKADQGYPMEGPPLRYPHHVFPSSIVGLKGYPVEDVVLKNIKITYDGGGNKDIAYFGADSLDKIPEKPSDYPEFSMFGELPSWGFYVRHVKGVTFENVQLISREGDFRPACIFDDVTGLIVTGVQMK